METQPWLAFGLELKDIPGKGTVGACGLSFVVRKSVC